MNWKKGLGIGLIFAGTYLILTNALITGAVIGTGRENTLGWGGILFFITGILSLILGRNTQYRVRSLEGMLKEEGEEDNTVFVLDSSGIIDYEPKIEQIIHRYSGRVYIPDSILRELHKDKKLMNKLISSGEIRQVNPREEPEKYQELTKLATTYLEKTRKHQDYLVLKRIIGEGVVPKGVRDKDLARYEKMEEELEARVKAKGQEPDKEHKLMMLERNYKVSQGDIDVLTTALYNVSKKRKARILAHDSHLKEATSSLIRTYKGLGKHLEYLDYREYQKAA